MNILIVEDDADFVEDITKRISSICRDPVFTTVMSRDSAIETIRNGFFDIIFLDLRIPTHDGAMDSTPENGRAVLDYSLTMAPGTPIFILTGSPSEEFLPDIWELNHSVNIWGQGPPLQVIGFQQKHRIAQLDKKIAPYIHGCINACDVEIDTAETLPIADSRLIKIFTRTVGGCFCKVDLIPGGMSGAHVYSLLVTDEQGAKIHNAIAKLSKASVIANEVERYDHFILRLDAGATPRKLLVLSHGARDISGVFYSLADTYTKNAFTFISSCPPQLVPSIAQLMKKWREAAYQKRTTIKFIRQQFIDDKKFEEIKHLISHNWIDNFEASPIQVNWGCTHGDLHGFNILVTDALIPILIDYGDVSENACSVDPITLELSSLFHLNSPMKGQGWPSTTTANAWGQDEFIDDACPASEFLKSCHEWAESTAVGRRERSAVAYGYLVRQLKYDDCDRSLVNALLVGVKRLYDRG